jgi:hypothetical protein
MGVLLLLLTGCGGKAATMAGGRHVAAAAASTAAAATSPETAPQTHTFILFADVTRSLTPQEQASVIANVQTVIGILPAGAHLYVFPLLEDVQRADAVFEGALPQIQTSSDAVALDMLRAKWNKVVAEKLQAILAGPPNGRNLTCVSGAFRKAEELTGDAGRGTEIVVISDMLEDCGDSLLHGSLQLQKASIERELAAARALPREQLLRLDGASVTAILPTVPTSGQRVARPPVHELKAFWRAVLDRCGDNAENFRFGTTVPKRLHDYKPPEEGSL